MTKYIFDCYPGSKPGYTQDGNYSAIFEPFVGGGRFLFETLEKQGDRINHIFLADSDPTVRVAYKVWSMPYFHNETYTHLQTLSEGFLCCVRGWAIATWSTGLLVGKVSDRFLLQICFTFRSAIKDALKRSPWQSLKAEFELADESDPARLTAVSILLRKLVFGGVVRSSDCTPELLNVSPSVDKLSPLLNWRFEFPPVPNAEIFVGSSWQSTAVAFLYSKAENAIAFIDPPYYADKAPGRSMTAAYRGHKPHDPSTLTLSVECLNNCLRSPRFTKVMLTNYRSRSLDAAIDKLAPLVGRSLVCTPKGRLTGMNQSEVKRSQNIEYCWSFGPKVQDSPKFEKAMQEAIA